MKKSQQYSLNDQDKQHPVKPKPASRAFLPVHEHALSQKTSNAAETLDFIQRGSFLVKVRDKGNRYRRRYHLENDLVTLHYKSKKFDCSSPDTTMSLTEIQEIREGALTDVFSKSFKNLNINEEQCFSLVHGEKHKTLDLIAENKNIRDAWVHGLKHLKKKLSEADLSTQQSVWMRELFKMADKNNDEQLTLKEILNLLKHLNISVNYDTAKEVFDQADTDKSRNKKGECSLTMEEFITFYKLLTSRPEIEDLFHKYNYEGKYLDADELHDFLSKEQKIELTEDECEALIREHEPCPLIRDQGMMGIDGFYSLFNSPLCDIFNDKHRKVYQDMTQPLSHYFIDSSHNTYLTSDQLLGDSAVESYIRALKMGCRCVELDCWDGDKGEPVIYHGHTFTSKILFKDVLGAVNLYAFEASEYPVILSIENHCSIEQQRMMAEYLNTTFGDKLLTKPYPDDMEELPSPKSLKGRIIVKGKKLPPHVEEFELEDDSDDDSDDDNGDDNDHDDTTNDKDDDVHVNKLIAFVHNCDEQENNSHDEAKSTDASPVEVIKLTENYSQNEPENESMIKIGEQNFDDILAATVAGFDEVDKKNKTKSGISIKKDTSDNNELFERNLDDRGKEIIPRINEGSGARLQYTGIGSNVDSNMAQNLPLDGDTIPKPYKDGNTQSEVIHVATKPQKDSDDLFADIPWIEEEDEDSENGGEIQEV